MDDIILVPSLLRVEFIDSECDCVDYYGVNKNDKTKTNFLISKGYRLEYFKCRFLNRIDDKNISGQYTMPEIVKIFGHDKYGLKSNIELLYRYSRYENKYIDIISDNDLSEEYILWQKS